MKGLHEAQINLSVLAVPKMERDRKYSGASASVPCYSFSYRGDIASRFLRR